MGKKENERRGPWQYAAVAAMQGARFEEQMQYLEPDVVEQDELRRVEGPSIGLGTLLPMAPSKNQPVDHAAEDALAHQAAARVWGRWDVHWRGRIVPR